MPHSTPSIAHARARRGTALRGLALAAAILLCAAPALRAQADTLVILHLNDTHGNLAPGAPRDAALRGTAGGIARAASVVGATRGRYAATLLLHAGDTHMGDLTFNTTLGVAEWTLLDQVLGVDAMTLGNHEFDLTPELLLLTRGQSGARFPLLSSNCVVLSDPLRDTLQSIIHPFAVREVQGVRVGIFGMTTPEANVLSSALPQAMLSEDIVGIAAAMVDTLRVQRQCDVVIMLSHLGIRYDRLLASLVPGIDAVIGGHDHYVPAQAEVLIPAAAGGAVPVVQADAFYRGIGRLRLLRSGSAYRFLDWQDIPLDATVPEEPTVAGMLNGVLAGIEQRAGMPLFSQAIGAATADFTETLGDPAAVGDHDTPVGNLVTDAMRRALQADIAITAGGSTAQPLHSGPIVMNDVMRMIGYGFNTVNGLGFRMMRYELSGGALMACLGYALQTALTQRNDEFLAQISGGTYRYDCAFRNDSMLVAGLEVRVGGQPINPAATYAIASNEFVFQVVKSVCDTLGLPIANIARQDSVTEFQVLVQHIASAQQVSPLAEGRVRCSSITSAEAPVRAPEDFRFSCHPQPASTQAVFSYTLPEAAAVRLALYDSGGRRVSDTIIGGQDAGSHLRSVAVDRLPAGVYLAALTAGGRTQCIRLLVVR